MTTPKELEHILDKVETKPPVWLRTSNRLLWKQAKVTVDAYKNEVPKDLTDLLPHIATHFHKSSERSFIFDLFAVGDLDKIFVPLRTPLEEFAKPFFASNKELQEYFSAEKIFSCYGKDASALHTLEKDLFKIVTEPVPETTTATTTTTTTTENATETATKKPESAQRPFVLEKTRMSLSETLFTMARRYKPEKAGAKAAAAPDKAEGEIPLCAIAGLKYLAEGGFAEVYKGYYGGRPVAVKILKSADANAKPDAGASAPARALSSSSAGVATAPHSAPGKITSTPAAAASPSSAPAAGAGNSETACVTEKEFADELASLVKLKSQHVVEVVGHRTSGSTKLIVMELMGSSLSHVLLSGIDLPWPRRLQMALEIAQGLKFLHDHRVIHCDLKAGNILIDLQGRCKITDFGLAVNKETSALSHAMGVRQNSTLAYMAPELFGNQSAFSWKSDVYAFGMILWEIASRKIPYSTISREHSAALIVQCVKEYREREEIPEDAPEGYAELMEACWQHEKDERPKLDVIIEKLEAIIAAQPK